MVQKRDIGSRLYRCVGRPCSPQAYPVIGSLEKRCRLMGKWRMNPAGVLAGSGKCHRRGTNCGDKNSLKNTYVLQKSSNKLYDLTLQS